jgi:hypothetical protein
MCEHLYLTPKTTTFLPCKPQLEHVCIVTIVPHQQTTNQNHHTITLSHIRKLYDRYKWNNSMLMTESAAIRIVLTPCRGYNFTHTTRGPFGLCYSRKYTQGGTRVNLSHTRNHPLAMPLWHRGYRERVPDTSGSPPPCFSFSFSLTRHRAARQVSARHKIIGLPYH